MKRPNISKRIYEAWDRGELCAQIEVNPRRRGWLLFWPRRAWACETFRTFAGARAQVERICSKYPVTWKVSRFGEVKP
jgi:hypothetical protein